MGSIRFPAFPLVVLAPDELRAEMAEALDLLDLRDEALTRPPALLALSALPSLVVTGVGDGDRPIGSSAPTVPELSVESSGLGLS